VWLSSVEHTVRDREVEGSSIYRGVFYAETLLNIGELFLFFTITAFYFPQFSLPSLLNGGLNAHGDNIDGIIDEDRLGVDSIYI